MEIKDKFYLESDEYAELCVGQEFMKLIKGISVFFPLKKNQKNIDFIMKDSKNNFLNVQVKYSRTYFEQKLNCYNTWFNKFQPNKDTDLYCFFSIIPKVENLVEKVKKESKMKKISYEYLTVVFTRTEMKDFFKNIVLTQKDKNPDRHFGFSYSGGKISYNRGLHKGEDASKYILNKQKAKEIEKMFKNPPHKSRQYVVAPPC